MNNLAAIPGRQNLIGHTLYDGETNRYLQAVLYDPKKRLVNTVNLDHIANGFYQGQFSPSGSYTSLAGYILVYTDEARTSRDNGYDIEPIQVDVKTVDQMGGGGGFDIDYKKVREIISEEIAKLDLPKTYNDTILHKAIKSLEKSISGEIQAIEMPAMPTIPAMPDNSEEFMSIVNAVKELQNKVDPLEGYKTALNKIADLLIKLDKKELRLRMEDIKSISKTVKNNKEINISKLELDEVKRIVAKEGLSLRKDLQPLELNVYKILKKV